MFAAFWAEMKLVGSYWQIDFVRFYNPFIFGGSLSHQIHFNISSHAVTTPLTWLWNNIVCLLNNQDSFTKDTSYNVSNLVGDIQIRDPW